MEPEFSIIVTTWNSRDCIVKLLDSLKHQTFADFEVWIADDGSTDDTKKVFENCTAGDSRFNFLPLQHTGTPSVGRNRALDKATGKYVIIVDSDDYLDEDCLEKYHADLTRTGFPQLLSVRVKWVDTSGKLVNYIGFTSPQEQEYKVMTGGEGLVVYGKDFTGHSFTKICRLDFLLKHKLYQLESVFMLEDLEWSFRIFFFAETIAFTNTAGYNYVIHSTSITRKYSSRTLTDVATSLQSQVDFFKKHRSEMSQAQRKVMANFICSTAWMFFFYKSSVEKSGPERVASIRKWRNFWSLWRDVSAIKKLLLLIHGIAVNTFGVWLCTCFFNKIYYPVCLKNQ